MKYTMKRTLAMAAVAALIAGPLFAASVNITNISGTWENTVLTNGGSATGEGTSAITWGAPATNAGQSGYTFVPTATPFVALSPFQLGEFTHNNFPIFAPSLISTDFVVSVMGDVDGNPFQIGSTYSVAHTETPNTTPCPAGSVSVCDDIVTISATAVSVEDSVVVDGEEFFLKVLGFQGGSLSFLTAENQANSRFLVAEFTTENILEPVPVPAGVILLGTGLAVFGALKRRRKS